MGRISKIFQFLFKASLVLASSRKRIFIHLVGPSSDWCSDDGMQTSNWFVVLPTVTACRKAE